VPKFQFPRLPRAIAVVAGTLLILALVPASALADEPTYPTRNGPKTESALRTELQNAGYQGPWDLASELNAYDRATAPWPTSPPTPAPAPILEQLPVIFAGGAVDKGGVPEGQASQEFSLAGGNYNLAGSAHGSGCSIYTELWSPEQAFRFGETGGQSSELRFGVAPAHSSDSSVFAIPNVPPGSHYQIARHLSRLRPMDPAPYPLLPSRQGALLPLSMNAQFRRPGLSPSGRVPGLPRSATRRRLENPAPMAIALR
jgi:hypothetical protein